MMTIIIELFSFLFWTRSVYGGTCKVSTHNTNDYMHQIVKSPHTGVSEFLVDATNLGCGETRFKWKDGKRDGSSATILTPISCDAIGENYVIDSILYASLGMGAGSCGELNYPYVPPTDANDWVQDARIWCNERFIDYERFICCFADYERFINIPEEIGQECIGESKCEITVDASGLYIGDVSYTFSDNDNEILKRINGPWELKVLFQCAPAPAIEGASGIEGASEYFEYKFVLDDSDFSEYSDVSVEIIGICNSAPDGITVNGPFNECVYWSFIFTVYSRGNYLGDTPFGWNPGYKLESCNKAYGPYSLPVIRFQTDLPPGFIHFTVTKSGGYCKK